MLWLWVFSRFAQSVIGSSNREHSGPEGVLQVYVDDPLVVLRGNPSRHRRLACMVATSWIIIMGVPLAFCKATLAAVVTWISVTIKVTRESLMVEVPSSKLTELKGLVCEALSADHGKGATRFDWQVRGNCISHLCVETVRAGDVCGIAWAHERTKKLCLGNPDTTHVALAPGILAARSW